MKMRVDFHISREDAQRYLLVAKGTPASKATFLKTLRESVWWYGMSEGCNSLDDEVREVLQEMHDKEHDDCGGPDHCVVPTRREQAVERLLHNYWE